MKPEQPTKVKNQKMNNSNYSNLEILYEDNHLLIINKKAGDLSQGDKTGDLCLRQQLMEHIKVKYEKPGNVYLGLAHRLDRPTSGAIIFCKTSKSLSRIQKAFAQQQVIKKYWALVTSDTLPKEATTLTDYLWKDSRQNKSFVADSNHPKAKKAILKFKRLKTFKDIHLLEIELITGRHHQIRVQLSNAGYTIIGDLKYGYSIPNSDKSIALHARSVSLKHPTKDEIIKIIAPLPEWIGWDNFRNT